MPVIVIGADTDHGQSIARGLWSPEREVRVFVSDPERAAELKRDGFKTAVGDVSDDSHVEAAATHCFTAVLVVEAALDNRERSFAKSPDEVMEGWARAVGRAAVQRVIWVTDSPHPKAEVSDVATVSPTDGSLVELVVSMDDAQLRR